MDKRAEEAGSEYKVVCSWCGVVIRRRQAKDSSGMCLKCFARMLSEHSRPHQQSDAPRSIRE